MLNYRSSVNRKRKRTTEVIDPNNNDRISQLSDDVLTSILSYLTTKEAVATSVLSKRWQCVWASTRELTIESGFNRLSYLTFRVFTSPTLVKLKIKGKFVVDIPASAATTAFPWLKILSLEGVVYSNDSSAQKLFSSCHVLEYLTVCRHDQCDGLRALSITVPPLKSLEITSSIPGHNKLKVAIDCPHLQYFEFHGESKIEFIGNLSSLVQAQIYGACRFDLYRKISGVEFLLLSDYAILELSLLYPGNSLPTFDKLVKLEILGEYVDWEFVPILLAKSPNLEVLVFPKGLVVPKDSSYGFDGFDWREPDSVPQCLISHLKNIRVDNFVGMKCEFQLLEYMIEFGEALERVEIRCSSFLAKWGLKKRAVERLKNLASREKAIVVHWPN